MLFPIKTADFTETLSTARQSKNCIFAILAVVKVMVRKGNYRLTFINTKLTFSPIKMHNFDVYLIIFSRKKTT